MDKQEEIIRTLSGIVLKKVKELQSPQIWRYFVNDKEVLYWSYECFPDGSFENIAIKFKDMELPNRANMRPSRTQH